MILTLLDLAEVEKTERAGWGMGDIWDWEEQTDSILDPVTECLQAWTGTVYSSFVSTGLSGQQTA